MNRFFYHCSVKRQAKRLQLRLKKSGYSEGRILKAVLKFKTRCYNKYSLDILRKETIKLIENGSDHSGGIDTTFIFSDEAAQKFSKILSKEHPSLTSITVYTGAYGNVGIIILP